VNEQATRTLRFCPTGQLAYLFVVRTADELLAAPEATSALLPAPVTAPDPVVLIVFVSGFTDYVYVACTMGVDPD
jgi:hypothetical protein